MPTAAILEFRRALNETDFETVAAMDAASSERRHYTRRQSHAAALIALCRREMASFFGEPTEERRERLRREADRAEYLARAKAAHERGDYSAEAAFKAWARVVA